MMMFSIFIAAIEDHGNDEKFTILYESYVKLVMKITFNYLSDFHYAEEAAQSAFFALAKNIDKIDLDETDKTRIYVCKCAKSAAFDILRKLNKAPETVNLDAFYDLAETENAESILEENEALRAMINTIKSMPERYRDVLSYKYLGDFRVSEIADMLHISVKEVRNLLYRGNKLLKRTMIGGSRSE